MSESDVEPAREDPESERGQDADSSVEDEPGGVDASVGGKLSGPWNGLDFVAENESLISESSMAEFTEDFGDSVPSEGSQGNFDGEEDTEDESESG